MTNDNARATIENERDILYDRKMVNQKMENEPVGDVVPCFVPFFFCGS